MSTENDALHPSYENWAGDPDYMPQGITLMAAPYNHDLDEAIAAAREIEHTALGFYLASRSDAREQALLNAYNEVTLAVDKRETTTAD